MWPLSHLLNFPSPYCSWRSLCQCSVIPCFHSCIWFFSCVLCESFPVLPNSALSNPSLACPREAVCGVLAVLLWALFMALQASLLIPSYTRLRFTLDQSVDGALLSIAFFTSFLAPWILLCILHPLASAFWKLDSEVFPLFWKLPLEELICSAQRCLKDFFCIAVLCIVLYNDWVFYSAYSTLKYWNPLSVILCILHGFSFSCSICTVWNIMLCPRFYAA